MGWEQATVDQMIAILQEQSGKGRGDFTLEVRGEFLLLNLEPDLTEDDVERKNIDLWATP